MPSSAATSTATAVASFVTDAHGKRALARRRGRLDAAARPRRRRARTATPSTCRAPPSRRHYRRWSGSSISSGAAFEDRVGYSRAVRVGSQVWVSGTAPIMPGDADPPDDAYEQARSASRSSGARSPRPARRLDDVVRTRIYVTRRRGHRRGRPCAPRGVRRRAPGDDRRSSPGCSTRAGCVEIEAEAVIRMTRCGRRHFPGATAATPASVLDHSFGAGDPYTLGVEEEYMLLDPETLGPRAAHRRGARRGRRGRVRRARITRS